MDSLEEAMALEGVIRLSKFLFAFPRPINPKRVPRKTRVWVIVNGAGEILGYVDWYSPWRRYVLKTEIRVFDAGCLTALAKFCDDQTKARKEERKLEKNGSA